ncbi:Hypothetical protein A7982_13313 [Minicystis rosea]|nr:Hypothetical protein A7982_13313 [Minicystis rosea]
MIVLNMIRPFARLGALAFLVSTVGCLAQPEAEDGAVENESVAEGSQAIHGSGDPLILQDTPQGARRYEKLAEGWLRWSMALPISTGPISDTTGESCDMGQSGHVWYLAGTFGGPVVRECHIPKNKELYLPLINFWAIPPTEYVDAPEELAEFVAFAEEWFPANRAAVCSLTLRLDGEDLLEDTAEIDQELWVDVLDPFKVRLNDDNYSGGPGGKRPAALIAGHFARLEPLSPGHHTLEFGGAQCENGETVFETSAVYDLHVSH